MKSIGTLGRILVPFSLLLLAACQNMPGKNTTTQAQNAPATEAAQSAQTAPAQGQQQQGAPVGVYLVDTVQQADWATVNTQNGAYYVNPQPILTRASLTNVQAGSNKEGEGLVALEFNEEGQKKLAQVSMQNPNKRIALVVGNNLITIRDYKAPLMANPLYFMVGSRENALAIGRAIIGTPAPAEQGAAPATQNGNGTAQ